MPWPIHEHPSSVLDTFTSFIPGYRLVDAEDLLNMAFLLFSSKEGIQGGPDQQSATQLKTYINQVTAGAAVTLPPGLPGRCLFVINDSPGDLLVYGTQYDILTGTQDKINGGIVTVQTQGGIVQYICYSKGLWRTFQGSTGAIAPGGSLWGSMIWGQGDWSS